MAISIRHARPDDTTAVQEICAGQTVINGTMRLPYAPAAHVQRRLEPSDGTIQLVAVARGRHEGAKDGEGEIVGYAELITYPTEPAHRHVGEVNMIAVREEWQGHGIGRQLMSVMLDLADNWLQLRRLGLLVWAGNERAMALYQQMGFTLEGTMPEFVYRNGRYVDAHVMGRLAQTRSVTTDSAVLDRELDLLVR